MLVRRSFCASPVRVEQRIFGEFVNEFLQLGASQVCLFLAKPGESEQDLRTA